MKSLRPREIPASLAEAPVFLSYSDGEGEGAGVGVAVWCPNGTVLGGYLKLHEEVRSVWSRSASASDHYDIFEIEAVGPALIPYNFGHAFTQDALRLHFIDNDAALATPVKGSSSILSGEVITAYTHEKAASLGLWSWFDRVASDDNPVDKLSRGVMQGPWRLQPIGFPPGLLSRLREYLHS